MLSGMHCLLVGLYYIGGGEWLEMLQGHRVITGVRGGRSVTCERGFITGKKKCNGMGHGSTCTCITRSMEV